ncbi:ATP-binding protein, partial [bacterium]|nr:ATP-binding protein [bacterium]
KGKEIDPIINEVSVTKQLIKERAHPLDLLRELLSNAGAREVGATEIRIKYTVDDEGHIFEVVDNGCGMNFTNEKALPGRLDKFFALGLSAIVGQKSDEFSWKGLGSKLSYQSKKIEINTWCGTGDAIKAEINEPWSSINRNLLPKPKVFSYKPEEGTKTGTSIKVFGHPPHRKEKPFTMDEIKKYLLHRTFVGYTKKRENPPKIYLSVLGKTEELVFGFPELKDIKKRMGTVCVDEKKETTKSGTNKTIAAILKGFYTWDDEDYGLDKNQLNTGLILSVRGIPYFNLDMDEFGSKNLLYARPGINKCCLILECDSIQEDMNISRSGLVDAENVDMLKTLAAEIFQKIETSPEYLQFRRVQEDRKAVLGAEELEIKKQKLESDNQKWVVYQSAEMEKPLILAREPENEYDALCILWKLEALDALPFKKFQTLGHAGTGPDLIVHFQEDEQSNPERYASIEIENKFYNYIIHGHKPSQYARILCWEIGKTTKIPLSKTDKKYMFTAVKENRQLHIFALRLMDTIKVLTKKELNK